MAHIITGLGHCGIKLVAYFGGLLVTNLNYRVGPTTTNAYYILDLTPTFVTHDKISLFKHRPTAESKVKDKQRCSSLAARLKSSGLMGNRWRFAELTRFNFLIRPLQWTRRNPALVPQ